MKKSLLFAAALMLSAGAWAEDWNTVWFTDFSSAPQGMTYSVSNGSVDISSGVLFYHQGGGSGNRAINTAFTADAFKVESNWHMEFDWGASSSNTNPSNVTFATNNGAAFTMTWEKYATTTTITDGAGEELTTTLPIDGYNKASMSNLSHFVVDGVAGADGGIYLTVTNGETTYVDNVKVSSTFGYPATFNGSLGRAVSHMALDNIYFKVPAVAGFVAAPTATLTGVNGTQRSFTLATLTEGASILWSESAPENNDYTGWTACDGSVTTTADPIYAVATDGTNYSEVTIIETGAGVTVSLTAPVISVEDVTANGDVFNPVFNASDNQTAVLLSPVSTLSATFNGVAVELPFTATENGVLAVTASADGYDAATTEIPVFAQYQKTWVSSDYSSLTADDVATVLGEAWTLQEATGRWASWTSDKEPYSYYAAAGEGVFNVTVEQNLKMRNVVLLNLGYGLSRNVSGTENIDFLNTGIGTIAEVKYYSGYGQDVSEENTHLSYFINATGEGISSFGCNIGKVLVQAAYYTPVTKTVCLKPAIWDVEDADERYAVYAFQGNYSKWFDFTATDKEGIYTAAIPDYFNNVVFVRMNGETKDNNWDNMWNQTDDIDLSAYDDNTLFTITGWGEGEGAKSTYAVEQTFTVSYVNVEGWESVYAYTFNGEAVGTWPGTQMTKTEEQVDGKDVYTITFTAETAPASIIFNNGESGDANQTNDLEFVNGKQYDDASKATVATSISAVNTAYTADAAIYNLAGQRVVKTQKGLYIVNGKKYMVK